MLLKKLVLIQNQLMHILILLIIKLITLFIHMMNKIKLVYQIILIQHLINPKQLTRMINQ